MQPIVNRTLVGPAPWPHSRFRLTEEMVIKAGTKLRLPLKEFCRRFEVFTVFVEEQGDWSPDRGKAAGIQGANDIHSTVYSHRDLLPRVYWSSRWAGITNGRIQDPDKAIRTEVAALNKRVAIAESDFLVLEKALRNKTEALRQTTQSLEESSTRHEALIATLDHDVGLLIKGLGKPKRGPSRLTRLRQELQRRVRVLLIGGK